MTHQNLAAMFFSTCDRLTSRTGMMFKNNGEFQSLSFDQMKKPVLEYAAGFQALGLPDREAVCILAPNSYKWAFCDYAILANGGVAAGIYPTLLPESIAYIINDCQARLVVVSDKSQFAKLMEVESELARVEKYILIDPEGVDHPKAMSLDSLREMGGQRLEEDPECVMRRMANVKTEQLAILIYTSGTTGEPKGVMLTHGNLLSNIEGGIRALPVSEADTFLSFLPLSHIFERMVGHYLAMYVGCTVAYAESIERVAENMLEVRPTLLASVPRLFEKIYGKVIAGVEEGSPLKKKIFYWATGVGSEVTKYRQKNMPIPMMLGIKSSLAHKLVFSKLIERVGGRIRFFVSGGAPLPQEIGEFFTAAGLQILEGYGLSETSPVITVNRIEKFKFGTVGVPLDNVEVSIAEDGEILTRGPHVMQGYFNKPDETAEAIDKDGWFHTGDIGEFDEDGMLRITDRKKNIIVTAGGKNVAPQRVENLLVLSRYIDQALVIGDRRKFCSAVIVPNFEELAKAAAARGISDTSPASLVKNSQMLELINAEVKEANKSCASYESIKKIIVIERAFTIESGELTPSLKVKRKAVETNYDQEINALYQ